MTQFRSKRALAAIALAALAAACASAPPPPEPTVAEVTVRATAGANPDPTGRPSPTIVHLYALKPGAPFAIGEYDALTGGELGELSESMTRIARLVVVPGEETKKVFELPPGSSDVGVTAAFRQVDTAAWRASAPVAPNTVTPLTATVGVNEVTLE